MLSNDRFLELVHGCVQTKEDGEYITFYRCNDYQINHTAFEEFYYVRSKFSASIKFEFYTEATKFGFDMRKVLVGSSDSFDLYVDNVAYEFLDFESLADECSISFNLPIGKKHVTLYLPNDSEIQFKNFWIDGNYEPVPLREKTMICYGDSITHGFGSYKAGFTYVHAMNRQMNFNVYNHGIGGYWYDENYISKLDGIDPDYILVSLGTNQMRSSDKYDRIDKFYENLSKTFPEAIVFVVTPIWRCDIPDAMELIVDMRDYIFNKFKDSKNIHVIDGLTLVPNIDYFFSDKLHPNAIGMEYYGNNLAKEIKNILKNLNLLINQNDFY